MSIAKKSMALDQKKRVAAHRSSKEESEMVAKLRENIVADRMKATATLASGIAHEINNPLTYVMGNMELIQRVLDDGRPPQPQQIAILRESVAEALTGAQRIRDLIKTMRSFSEEESIVYQPADFMQVVEHAIRMTQHHHRNRVRFTTSLSEAPVVSINQARLGQLCLNLLSNAAQALPKDNATPGTIRVSLNRDTAGHAVFEVSDNGRGMSLEEQTHALDPFFTTKEPGFGTGLGLTICHDIVSKAGGSLSVSSRVGAGTTVRVSIPPHSGVGKMSQDADAIPQKILVVDDDRAIRALAKRALRKYGVESVASVTEALERCRRSSYAVILCELTLPGMSGMRFYQKLAACCPGAEQRITFLAGAPITKGTKDFLATIPNQVLYKPFSICQLLEMLDLPASVSPRLEPCPAPPQWRKESSSLTQESVAT